MKIPATVGNRLRKSMAEPAAASKTNSTNGNSNLSVREKNAQILDEFIEKLNQQLDGKFNDIKSLLIDTLRLRPSVDRNANQFNKLTRFKEQLVDQKPAPSQKTKRKIESHISDADGVAEKKLRSDAAQSYSLDKITAELAIDTIRQSDDSMTVVLTLDLIWEDDNGASKLARELDCYAQILTEIKEYQIYGCQEASGATLPNIEKWILIGGVEPCTPPIKCTLTDFVKGCTYNFAIRIKYTNDSISKFSKPQKVKL